MKLTLTRLGFTFGIAVLIAGCARERSLFEATSADGHFRAEIVSSNTLGTYRAQLRLWSGSPRSETARITLLDARDTEQEVTDEIRGLRWNGGTLEISVDRQRLLYPQGIVAIDVEHGASQPK